jgi:hypothetical protein
MRPHVLTAAAVVLAAAAAVAAPGPWQRTETRAPCAAFDTLRAPFFGDTHVHTTYSFDAVSGDVRTGPRDAYRFALGEPIGLPPYDAMGAPLRTVQLGRPLDFTVVTDHSEFFGEVQLCLTPGLPGFDSSECTNYRTAIPQTSQIVSPGVTLFGYSYLTPANPARFGFCGPGNADCLAQASLVWQDTQAAAEQFYDRTAACGFTTFVGYEWTSNLNVQNLHRNVLFRTADVPDLPVTYMEEPTPQGLWAALRTQCLDGIPGCDVLAIPHNSNLSNGAMFRAEGAGGAPLDATQAAFRAAMEPLVELTQHKGDSECRPGILTSDEQCGFEKWSGVRIGIPPVPGQTYDPLLFVRNVLKTGLLQEEALGTNPFRLGFIGSTDTHNATPGATREDDYQGHLGTRDATPQLMLAGNAGLGVIGGIESNAGGLAVVWAEENSRDALFAAMRRREVYATSGIRPVVRFFAGDLTGVSCASPDFVGDAYRGGTPMGGELGPVRGDRSPRFAVLAFQDAGEPGVPGTPLQRIQIVKGWVDAGGTAQEKVFDVAGTPENGASVDLATCTPTGPGATSLCTLWEDPEFARDQRAFYYARVLENPVCRWSTRLCNAQGVDCAAPPPAGFEACCDPQFPKTIQERAWTSPVWYRPEGLSEVKGRVSFGPAPASDRLTLRARVGRLPQGFDLATQDLRVTLSDDDVIWDVVMPAGTLRPRGARRFEYADGSGALGGVRRAAFSLSRTGEATLKLRTVPLALGAADRTEHMVRLDLSAGTWTASETRLWDATPRRLASR